MLAVIDKCSRESVLLETSVSLMGQSVVEALKMLCEPRSMPQRVLGNRRRACSNRSLAAGLQSALDTRITRQSDPE